MRRRNFFLSLALLALVACAFLPALQNGFVGYDDPDYVTANDRVQGGLNARNVLWAFQATAAANWHPLTWLSHMLDCQLFALDPRGHHLTSILLHAAAVVVLFLALKRMTGSPWRSFLVAAFFGLHPLRVESVAWVAERKDVLSALFWMLTMWAYARYATSQSRRRPLYYGAALLFFALGLMSKPMLVTLPFALLLLDYWPLGRFSNSGFQVSRSTTERQSNEGLLHYSGALLSAPKLENGSPQPQALRRLVLEKLPFLLLSIGASVMTFIAQERAGTVSETFTWTERLSNAVVSYCRYLGKMVWPADLAVFYPHPSAWPVWAVAGSIVTLTALTFIAVLCRRKQPYLVVGWFWYLGTLVPVIGLVQVGSQAMADRYTYIPSIGILLMGIWAAYDLAGRWRRGIAVASVAAILLLGAGLLLTARQITCWHDSVALFQHAIAVTKDNYLAHDNLGTALNELGRLDESIVHHQEALRLKPNFAEAHNNLGSSLQKCGRLPEAAAHYIKALELKPELAGAHYNLANALIEAAQPEAAIGEFEAALRLNPDYIEARYNRANTLAAIGRHQDAIREYREILRRDPGYWAAWYNLGMTLLNLGRWEEAAVQFEEFIRLKPGMANGHAALGAIRQQQNRLAEAAIHYAQAVHMNPGDAKMRLALGTVCRQQGRLDAAIEEFRQALAIHPNNTEARQRLEETLAEKEKVLEGL